MTDYFRKLRIIGVPFGISWFVLLVVYTLCNWLIFDKLQWLSWDKIIPNFFIPILLTCALVYFCLRPAVKQFYFKIERRTQFFYFVLGFALCIPTIMVQEYMEIASGRLTEINAIADIDQAPVTKYYRLKQYYLYKEVASSKLVTNVTGKHNQDFNMTLYVVQPILNRKKDTVRDATHYWFCTQFHNRISNSKSNDEKENAIREFVSASEKEFNASTPAFSYLERDARSNFLKYYGKAGHNNQLIRDGADIYLFPQKGAFADRTGKRLKWIFIMIGIVSSLVMLYVYFISLKTTIQVAAMKRKESREAAKTWQEQYEWIVPKAGFQTTPYLLFALVGVYLLMVFSGCGVLEMEGSSLYDWGALFRPAVANGEWWRIVTAMFLHLGIIHLLNNLVSLYFASLFLEPVLGSGRLLLLYMVSGIVASITSLWWNDTVLSVGASGAIFGLFGFLLALKLFGSQQLQLSMPFLILSPIFIGINLIMGFISPAVDNAGHVGGLLIGFVLGALFYPWVEKREIVN